MAAAPYRAAANGHRSTWRLPRTWSTTRAVSLESSYNAATAICFAIFSAFSPYMSCRTVSCEAQLCTASKAVNQPEQFLPVQSLARLAPTKPATVAATRHWPAVGIVTYQRHVVEVRDERPEHCVLILVDKLLKGVQLDPLLVLLRHTRHHHAYTYRVLLSSATSSLRELTPFLRFTPFRKRPLVVQRVAD